MYNILANKIAEDIVTELGDEVGEVHVRILSQIGKPIDQPQTASIQVLVGECDRKPTAVNSDIKAIADSWLENIAKITDLVVKGKVSTF
jgi:S-adenosylmethionine synthetase